MIKKVSIIAILLLCAFIFWHQTQKKKPVQKFDIIVVGTNSEYPPFTFMQDGIIVGFDIDLVREAIQRLGKKMELKDMPFDALIPAAQLGSIQIIAAGITATKEREKNLLFTKPYISGDPLIIVSLKKAGTTIQNVDDLKDKKVIVNEGFVADFYMSDIEGPQLLRLPTLSEGFLALKAARADAFVTARNSAQPFFDKYGTDDYNIVIIEGTSDNYSFGISKKHPQLLAPMQQALDAMQTDGTIATLKEKWNIQ